MWGHPSHSHQGGKNCGNAATTLRGVNSFSERNFFLETHCTSKDWDEDQVEERMNNFSWLFQAPLCLAVFLELCKCFCPARENTSLKRLPGKWCKYKKMSKLAQFFFSFNFEIIFPKREMPTKERCRMWKHFHEKSPTVSPWKEVNGRFYRNGSRTFFTFLEEMKTEFLATHLKWRTRSTHKECQKIYQNNYKRKKDITAIFPLPFVKIKKWNVAFDKVQHVWPWFWSIFQTFNFDKEEESTLNSNNN